MFLATNQLLVSLFFQPASSVATSTNNEHDDSKQSVVVAQPSENPGRTAQFGLFRSGMADLQQLLVSMTTGKQQKKKKKERERKLSPFAGQWVAF